jgi:hypothetical protein
MSALTTIQMAATRIPIDLFMRQVCRTLTAADEGLLVRHRVLICDQDHKWSRDASPI